jgi:hypothetical protein
VNAGLLSLGRYVAALLMCGLIVSEGRSRAVTRTQYDRPTTSVGVSFATCAGDSYGFTRFHPVPSGVHAVVEVWVFQCSVTGAVHWHPLWNGVTSTS